MSYVDSTPLFLRLDPIVFDESYPGEEPRYRYAVLLSELGKKDQARALLDGLLKKYRQASPRWRKDQKVWHRLAKAKLKTLPVK